MTTPKVEKFAKVLFFLQQQKFLDDPDFSVVVGTLLREAMETHHPHTTTHFRSRGAAEAIAQFAPGSKAKYQAWCKSTLRHEHIVPTCVRKEILQTLPEPTEQSFADSLNTFGIRATILKTEDDILNKAKLKDKMPTWFWSKGTVSYLEPMARYIETGLDKELVARKGACWFADKE